LVFCEAGIVLSVIGFFWVRLRGLAAFHSAVTSRTKESHLNGQQC